MRIITMGEIMLRLSPQGFNRLADNFNVIWGGITPAFSAEVALFSYYSRPPCRRSNKKKIPKKKRG